MMSMYEYENFKLVVYTKLCTTPLYGMHFFSSGHDDREVYMKSLDTHYHQVVRSDIFESVLSLYSALLSEYPSFRGRKGYRSRWRL